MKDRYDSDIYVNDAESYWERMQQWFEHCGIEEYDMNKYMSSLIVDTKTPKWELRYITECYMRFLKNAEEHIEDNCHDKVQYDILKDEYNELADRYNYLVSLINISHSNNKVERK